jgi:hypothetical protein
MEHYYRTRHTACVYAVLVSVLIYREIRWTELGDILMRTSYGTSGSRLDPIASTGRQRGKHFPPLSNRSLPWRRSVETKAPSCLLPNISRSRSPMATR